MKFVARSIIGLWAAATVALVVAALVGPAAAEARGHVPELMSATTRPATTLPPVTTPTTAPSPSASTSPTTKTTATRPRGTTAATVAATTTTAPPTTVAPLPAAAPPPVTLPLATTTQSGHVNAVFPILGGLGLASLVALLVTQWFLTKPGRRGPTL